jgi:hypothetical protein
MAPVHPGLTPDGRSFAPWQGARRMDEAGFWNIVERVHTATPGDMDSKCALLKQELARLPKNDAADFARHFDEKMDRAFDWSLWGAAYVINGGCSDDTFSDFRASLISRGRKAYDLALANPDSLAGEPFDEDAWFPEGYQYAVSDGVAAAGSERHGQVPTEPSGTAWQEEAVYDLFPKLSAKFG